MALTYGFYNSYKGDRKYNAEQISELFDGILKDGIIPSQGELFAVTTANDGMQINVGTGRAWFNHTWTKNDSTMVLTVPQSDITRDRWDAVVLEVNHSEDARANRIMIVSGIAGVDPQKPALTNTDKVKQYPLAYILVHGATEVINAEDIENAVGLEPTVFATGILETVSLNDLWNQWQGEFTTWFNDLKAQLSDDVVANLQYQIGELANFTYDIPDNVLNQWGITDPESKAMKDIFEGLFKPVLRTKTLIFTEDAIWNIPDKLIDRRVNLRMFGGGGSGGKQYRNGGGGGGEMYYGEIILPEEANAVAITVGKGGVSGSGGVTSFGVYASASGGAEGGYDGGSGGTGGGAGGIKDSNNGGSATYGGGGGGGGGGDNTEKLIKYGLGGAGGTYGGGGGGGGGYGSKRTSSTAAVLRPGGTGGAKGLYGGKGGNGGSSTKTVDPGDPGNDGASGTNTINNENIDASLRGPGSPGLGDSGADGFTQSSTAWYCGYGGGGGGGGGYGGNGGNGSSACPAMRVDNNEGSGYCNGLPGGGGGGGGYGGNGGNGGIVEPGSYLPRTSSNRLLTLGAGGSGGGGGGYGANGGDGGSTNYYAAQNSDGGDRYRFGYYGGGGGGGGYGPNGHGGNGGSGAYSATLLPKCYPTAGGIAAGGGGGSGASDGTYNASTPTLFTDGAPGGDGIVILTYSYLAYMYGNKE